MAKSKVTIGGDIVKKIGVEAIKDLQENRTMIVQKLTQNPPSKPAVIDNLKSIDDVFDHFKPSAEVKFKDKEGSNVSEELSFNSLADFGLKGLTEKSNFLRDVKMQSDAYQQILRELKGNNRLKKAIADEGGKSALIKALMAVIREIEESESK
jgi:hypothetical protein